MEANPGPPNMEIIMSLLAGKHFRHVETEAIVQVIETTFGKDTDTGKPTMLVKIACECGSEHYFEIESFILTFELVEEFRTATLTASVGDAAFWEAVEELAAEFDATLEYDDGSDPMMGAVMEAEEHEGGDLEGVERLH